MHLILLGMRSSVVRDRALGDLPKVKELCGCRYGFREFSWRSHERPGNVFDELPVRLLYQVVIEDPKHRSDIAPTSLTGTSEPLAKL